MLLTSSGLRYHRRRGCSPPPPQLRASSLDSLTFTSAEGGVAEVRGEPADQPGCPEEQPGQGAGSQDAGTRRPRRARGASCGHGRNTSTASVLLHLSPVTRTDCGLCFHPRTTLQLQIPQRPALAPPLIAQPGRGKRLRKRNPCALGCLGNDPWLGEGGALAGLWTQRAALGPHSPSSAPFPVHNRMPAGWTP